MGDWRQFEGRRTFAEFLTESCGRRKHYTFEQHHADLLEVAGWNGLGARPPVTIMPDGTLVVGQVAVIPVRGKTWEALNDDELRARLTDVLPGAADVVESLVECRASSPYAQRRITGLLAEGSDDGGS